MRPLCRPYNPERRTIKITAPLQDQGGGTILLAILTLAVVLQVGFIAYLSIKVLELKTVNCADEYNVSTYAQQAVYRKYTWLLKNVNADNWRTALKDSFDFISSQDGTCTLPKCSETSNEQIWQVPLNKDGTLKLPYTISVSEDGSTFTPIPSKVYYNADGTLTDGPLGAGKDSKKWQFVRIENLPVQLGDGSDPTKKVYCQVLLNQNKTPDDKPKIKHDVCASLSPIAY
ncbi:MAG: hypothetical protein V1753_02055 [Pseudomonadota bacterium]